MFSVELADDQHDLGRHRLQLGPGSDVGRSIVVLLVQGILKGVQGCSVIGANCR